MPDLQEVLQSYAAYHRNSINNICHWIGIPIISFSLLAMTNWLYIGITGLTISCNWLILAAALIYYFRLDRALGLIMGVAMLPITAALSLLVGHSPTLLSFAWVMGFFIAGWAIQFIGHLFERRRPAFTDNIGQLASAPLYILCKIIIALGKRKDLQRALAFYK